MNANNESKKELTKGVNEILTDLTPGPSRLFNEILTDLTPGPSRLFNEILTDLTPGPSPRRGGERWNGTFDFKLLFETWPANRQDSPPLEGEGAGGEVIVPFSAWAGGEVTFREE